MILSGSALRASSRLIIHSLKNGSNITTNRCMSSAPEGKNKRQLYWQVGTAVALGATYAVVTQAVKYSVGTDDEDDFLDGPVKSQAEITSRVFFDIDIDDRPVGRIVMGLHGTVVPKTVKNFETLCKGNERHPMGAKLAFEGSFFHRIIPNFMIQGGDFTAHNGTGGLSIYGEKFEDENFQLSHRGPGILSMANAGRHTNGSQFFITTKRAPSLDGRHVVFGVVESGWDVVKKIEACGSSSGTPSQRVTIVKAGVMEQDEKVGNEKK